MALCDTLKAKGVDPLTCGTGSTPWMASGWFDYLDLRINGAPFHRELLAGKHSFDSAEVAQGDGHLRHPAPVLRPEGPLVLLAGGGHAAGATRRPACT